MTGAPEKYEAKSGTATPCSQCAHSRCPAHKYSASSWYAVFDHTSRRDRPAWITRMHANGHGPVARRSREKRLFFPPVLARARAAGGASGVTACTTGALP